MRLVPALLALLAAGHRAPSGDPSPFGVVVGVVGADESGNGGSDDGGSNDVVEGGGHNDGFRRNSVNVATCQDSNVVGSSGSYW